MGDAVLPSQTAASPTPSAWVDPRLAAMVMRNNTARGDQGPDVYSYDNRGIPGP